MPMEQSAISKNDRTTQSCKVDQTRVEDQLLVCSFAEIGTTQGMLERYFCAHQDSTILFDNKYFKTSVTLRIVHEPEHDLLLSDDTWKRDLPHFPAVVLLSSNQQPETISKCKSLWDRLQTVISEDAIRILFLDGEDTNEMDTYGLVAWGLTKQIEVVNMRLSREDGIDLSVRLKRTLECAPWPSISHTITQEEGAVSEIRPKPVVRDEVQESETAPCNLSEPTRLRRGLEKRDLRMLVAFLVMDDDDSDSDSDID